jgi:hypothetical protein
MLVSQKDECFGFMGCLLLHCCIVELLYCFIVVLLHCCIVVLLHCCIVALFPLMFN